MTPRDRAVRWFAVATRWAAVPFVLLIRAYQLLLSPLLGPTCRFYPSCSAYALLALRRYGLVRGGWLAIRRLARCHPWNPGGVDHVPRRVDPSAAHNLNAESGTGAAEMAPSRSVPASG